MPHSAASFQRHLEHQSDVFLFNIRLKLYRNDPTTFRAFLKAIDALGNAPEAEVLRTFNACLAKYPQFCDRIVGFYPDGRLKEQVHQEDTAPTTLLPPARFSDDILAYLVQIIPFPFVGRLARTCKWMNTHITRDMVEQALARARERFGRVEFILEGPRPMLRVRSIEDELIQVGQLCNGSSIFVLQTHATTFIGTSHDTGPAPVGRFAVIAHAAAVGPDVPSVWFKRADFNGGRTVAITFIIIRNGNPYSTHCCAQFDAL